MILHITSWVHVLQKSNCQTYLLFSEWMKKKKHASCANVNNVGDHTRRTAVKVKCSLPHLCVVFVCVNVYLDGVLSTYIDICIGAKFVISLFVWQLKMNINKWLRTVLYLSSYTWTSKYITHNMHHLFVDVWMCCVCVFVHSDKYKHIYSIGKQCTSYRCSYSNHFWKLYALYQAKTIFSHLSETKQNEFWLCPARNKHI